MMLRYLSIAPLLLAIASPAYAALDDASSTSGDRQQLSDAWWTGPLIANSAGALPQGHYLIEPYLYDVRSPHLDSFGSLTYLQYGITDRWMAGLIPTFAYNRVNNGPSSDNIEPGDLSVQAQYSLHSFHEGSWLPAMALMVQETLPTGRYDQLNHPLADAQGSGTYTTTIQLNTQTYFWLPNGRILRMRFNIGGSFSSDASIRDVSVYGTPPGFRGHASPGNGFLVNAAWEYSMTQHWVLAFDLAYHYTNVGTVHGTFTSQSGITPLSYHLGSSANFAFAPAIEYNWRSNLGVIVGVRVFTGGHNSTDTVTPAIALNYVH
jgi:hypothetical protein